MTWSQRMARRIGTILVVLAATGAVVHGQAPDDLETKEEQAFKAAAVNVAPSVVRIQTVGGLDRVGRMLTGTGATTGLIVSADGYVISSAFNFISKPASVLVTLADGRRFPAKIVANDRARMLTLLKIAAEGLSTVSPVPRKSFRVGQWAIALGRTYDNPLPNLSVGILSALDRVWGRAVQTDAKISPANYGGPLVDIQGRVIGVLVPLSQRRSGQTAGVEWYDSGIGFAIPMVDILSTLPRLKTGEDLLPGLMGITLKRGDVYAVAAVIDRVRFNSPAEKSGMKPGDVIASIDGREISRLVQVRNALGNKYAGETIKVVVRRGDKNVDQQIQLVGKLEPYAPAYLGILPRRRLVGDKTVGVTVRGILPESPASQAKLLPGDRVVRVDETAVTDVGGLLDVISRHRIGETVKVQVERREARQTLTATLSRIPSAVPAIIESAIIEAPDPKPANLPATGRISEDLAGHNHNFWAYVPETYNPAHGYGLVVWIHPGGDTMEADIHDLWKPICEERGLILVGPRAKKVSGWNLGEAGFVEALVQEMQKRYRIDGRRIVLHSYSDGARFGYHLAFRYRSLFRGVAVSSEPLRLPPPENRPELRLQFFLSCGDKDNLFGLVQKSRARLETMKYPVTLTPVTGDGHNYPPVPVIDAMGRWIDLLDRI
ncbi:MAG: PDZ domain-containing protein [Planctomycetaceae bacterium]